MLFRVLTGAGYGGNSGAAGNHLAREMQTLSERRLMYPDIPDNVLIGDENNVYDYIMSMPEGPDKEIALAELSNEMSKPQYWYGEDVPRDNTLRSSSSWVSDIDYDPRTRTFKSGNYEVYGVEPEVAAAVLNGTYSSGNGSVGRSLINLWRLKGWGKNSGKGPLA